MNDSARMGLKLLWTTNWIKSFEQKLFCQVRLSKGRFLKAFHSFVSTMKVMKPWNLTSLSSDQNSKFIQLLHNSYIHMYSHMYQIDGYDQRWKFQIHPIVVTSNFWGNRSLDGGGGQGVEFNYTSWTSSPQDEANLAVRLNFNTF